MTLPAKWRLRLANHLTHGHLDQVEHDLRARRIERDLAQDAAAVARSAIEQDPDCRAHTTLGAVLHRATRADGMATIRVAETVLDHWLTEHRLASTGRAEQLADTPMPDVEPGPGDRSALPANPSYAGAVS